MLENSKKAYEIFIELTKTIHSLEYKTYEEKFNEASELLLNAQNKEHELRESKDINVELITAISYIRKAENARDLCSEIPTVYSFCAHMIQNLGGCSCDGGCGCHEDGCDA